jgi:hypothetical protein
MEIKTKNKSEVKEFTGNLEQVATIKETRIPKRYSMKIKVNGRWFILFGTEEQLQMRIKPFETGQQVKIRYTTSVYNDKEYYTAINIKTVKQSSLDEENSNSSSIEHQIKVMEDSLLLQLGEIEQMKKRIGCKYERIEEESNSN